MTESYFLSKLLPTFDEEDDEDEEINMMNDDIGTDKFLISSTRETST